MYTLSWNTTLEPKSCLFVLSLAIAGSLARKQVMFFCGYELLFFSNNNLIKIIQLIFAMLKVKYMTTIRLVFFGVFYVVAFISGWIDKI